MSASCPTCGQITTPDEAFCGNCGRPLGGKRPTAVMPPSQPPVPTPGGMVLPRRRDNALWLVSGGLAAIAVVGLIVALAALNGADEGAQIVAPADTSIDEADLTTSTEPTNVETTQSAPAEVAPSTSVALVPTPTEPTPTLPATVPVEVPPAPTLAPATVAPTPTVRPIVTAAPAVVCTRNVTYANEHLKSGDCGDPVADLQRLLVCVGYSVSIDGIFGQSTEDAVRAFQRSYNLTVDGQAGPGTRSELEFQC